MMFVLNVKWVRAISRLESKRGTLIEIGVKIGTR
jgi:hypothetical protein